jgi:hypothetical protein
MASILKVDALTGVTTAGSISVTGEGNSNTTNLQQGLAKAWANIDGSGTVAIRDSLNTSGLTDEGTGEYKTAFSTSFGNVNYSFTYCGGQNGSETTYQMDTVSMVVESHKIRLKNGAGSSTDRDYICGTFHGDLA